jgi:hypothetical protein
MTASFRIINVETAAECQLCGALVAYNAPGGLRLATNVHAEWHRTLDNALDPAPLPFQCAICFCPIDGDQNVCGTCAELANEGAL